MKSIEHTMSFELAAPVSDVFPLFSPEGEKEWAPGWDYHDLMGTTELFEDYIFLTNSHDHGSTDAIWLVKRYGCDTHLVEFYKVEPDDKIGVVKVTCTQLASERTKVEVSYKYQAISENGEKFVSEFTAAVYEDFMGEWRMLLSNHIPSKAQHPPSVAFNRMVMEA